MKKKFLLALALPFILASCSLGNVSNTSGEQGSSTPTTSGSTGVNTSGNNTTVDIEDDNVTTTFQLTSDDGINVPILNGVYTITTGGTYHASGKLDSGSIYVNTPDDEVELDLEGVSITSTTYSPIYVEDSSEFTLKVKKDTTNYIYDFRETDYSNTETTQGTAAIYSKNGDIKVNGKGTLSVMSYYNSGIHSKDNVTVKNLTLSIKAMNNGIKGNDKVTIEENPTIDITAGNNGIITSNSDMGSKAQHGYIYINGGAITINSYGDGIDAAYAVEFNTSTDSDGNTYTPVVDIYTNKYSTYGSSTTLTSESSVIGGGPGWPGGNPGGGGFPGGGTSAEKADDSAKGIKANESITINAGKIFTYTYDDGLHTNNDTLDTGLKASANIIINNGELTLKASDDAIHADGTLTISGGIINVSESHEGLEGNIINITGGNTTVVGSDDGVNASKQINISGGLLDVTVNPNGDTDGIDSNGTITISGGVIITRGPNNMNMAPIDADSTMKMTGGILIVIGYAPSKLSYGSLTKTTLSTGKNTGTYTVTVGDTDVTYTNTYSYSGNVTVFGNSKATIK